MKETMTSGERFIKCISFEPVDRIPCMDFGYWKETIDEWHEQGLPKEIYKTHDVEAYFGIDRGFETNLVNMWSDSEGGPIGLDWRMIPKLTKYVVEETDEIIAYGGEIGHIVESKIGSSIPYQDKFPVSSLEDFRRLIEPRMDPRDPRRITPIFREILERNASQKQATGIWLDGFFAWPRELMGPENVLYAYFDEPELLHEMLRVHTEFCKGLFDVASEYVPIEYVCIWEDMAYNHGSLISPAIFEEFMTPHYHEIIEYVRARGVKKILVDSDGDTVALSDQFVDAGVDGLYPLEINARADQPALVRARHPKLALIGGINKLALTEDYAAIDRELDKLPPMLELGGFIPSLDHRVQPGVSMKNYQHYIDKKREVMEKYGRLI